VALPTVSKLIPARILVTCGGYAYRTFSSLLANTERQESNQGFVKVARVVRASLSP